MFVRITIEFYIVPSDVMDGGTNPSTPRPSSSRSDSLKAAFNIYLEEVGGFENWRESAIAEQMLDDAATVLESTDVEEQYLLHGEYEGCILHFIIDWKQGKKPRIRHAVREWLYWRVK